MCRAAALPASPFCPPPPSPHLSLSARAYVVLPWRPCRPPHPQRPFHTALLVGGDGGLRPGTTPSPSVGSRAEKAWPWDVPVPVLPPSQAPHLPSASVSAQAWVPGPCASGLALFLQMTPGSGTLLASAAGCTLPSRGWAKMALGGFGLALLKDKS